MDQFHQNQIIIRLFRYSGSGILTLFRVKLGCIKNQNMTADNENKNQ